MEIHYRQGILFLFRRPNSIPRRQPSEAMTEALRHLAESDEMKPFIAAARAQRRNVVVEVFHASDGHPLLIHAAAPKREVQGRANAGTGTVPAL
jgi:hypothetical protein